MSTHNRRTSMRAGTQIYVPVAAGVLIVDGALVVLDRGYAAPGRPAPGLTYLGRAEQRVDNREQDAGVSSILVRRDGIYQWDTVTGAAAITQADVGKIAYVFDDRTVTRNPAGASPAGRWDERRTN